MKVLLDTKISFSKYSNKKHVESTAVNSKKEEKSFELPRYNQFRYNVNFGNKKFVSATNQKLITELEHLRLEKENLLTETVDVVVKEAKSKLAELKDWYDSSSYYYQDKVWRRARDNADYAGSKARSKYRAAHNAVYRFFNGDGSDEYNKAYEDVMEKEYHSKYRRISDINSKKSLYDAIISNSNKTEEERKKRLVEIEKAIDTTQKLINYQGLQDAVNLMLGEFGGINDRIAGYEKEKDEIKTKFVDLLIKSLDDKTIKVPPAILLYGPNGTGKTSMAYGLAEQLKDYAELVKLSGVTRGAIEEVIRTRLDHARNRYRDEHKRTIILLDDAEKYFSIEESDAPIIGVTLDDFDRNELRASSGNRDIISFFKQLLDTCSLTPDEIENDKKDPFKHGVTFLITTNFPHLISPDLLLKADRITKIPIGLASDENLAKVMRHHFKIMDNVAQTFRVLKDNPEGENYINTVQGITTKGRKTLIRMLKEGTIDQLHVDYMNMPYDKLTKGLGPDPKIGAYSNNDIHKMAKEAFLDYLEQANDGGDFRDSFYKVFRNTKREINAERLKKFNLIDRMIKDAEIDTDSLEELISQRELGLLSVKKENLLQYHLTKIKTELESLREYEIADELTEEQKAKKIKLEELVAKIEGNESKDLSISEAETDFE